MIFSFDVFFFSQSLTAFKAFFKKLRRTFEVFAQSVGYISGINLLLIVFVFSALLRASTKKRDVVLCVLVCGDDWCDECYHENALVEAQSSDFNLSSKWRTKQQQQKQKRKKMFFRSQRER